MFPIGDEQLNLKFRIPVVYIESVISVRVQAQNPPGTHMVAFLYVMCFCIEVHPDSPLLFPSDYTTHMQTVSQTLGFSYLAPVVFNGVMWLNLS